MCPPSEFLNLIGDSDGDRSFTAILEVLMCTECITNSIRTLVEIPGNEDRHDWYYTLRAGHGVWGCGVMIVGPQEEVATFVFTTIQDDGLVREAEPGDKPDQVSAHIRIIDPIGWVHFFTAFAASLGKSEEDHYEVLHGLEDEVTTLFPRLEELMRDPYEDGGES